MNIRRIRAVGDRILEYMSVQDVDCFHLIGTLELPGLADSEHGCQGNQRKLIAMRILLPENIHHFSDCPACVHFTACHNICLGAVFRELALEPAANIVSTGDHIIPACTATDPLLGFRHVHPWSQAARRYHDNRLPFPRLRPDSRLL